MVLGDLYYFFVVNGIDITGIIGPIVLKDRMIIE
jgi:hypothetical protein